MSSLRNHRLPISTRHAFALAFDLAVRRDALHSIVVPLLLHAPWLLALAMLPPLDETDQPTQVVWIWCLAVLGDYIVQLTVGAMLRFRAKSVFNTPVEVRPAPAHECYARGLRRLPWLFMTEAVRNTLILFATFFLVIPAIFLGFRLSFATEAVVLHEPHLAGAFQRSFRYAEGRFERWFEMIVISVGLGFAAIIVAVGGCWAAGIHNNATLQGASQLTIAAITPIIQYAWTFFYLRLAEIDPAEHGVEVGPAYAATEPAAVPESPAPTGPDDSVLTLARAPQDASPGEERS